MLLARSTEWQISNALVHPCGPFQCGGITQGSETDMMRYRALARPVSWDH